MEKDIYQRLAQHLDNLPGGFPPTETGVELRILRRLFSPEEAELAVHLTLIPEESRVIARRAKISREDAVQRLEQMATKGLIFRIQPEGPRRRGSRGRASLGRPYAPRQAGRGGRRRLTSAALLATWTRSRPPCRGIRNLSTRLRLAYYNHSEICRSGRRSGAPGPTRWT